MLFNCPFILFHDFSGFFIRFSLGKSCQSMLLIFCVCVSMTYECAAIPQRLPCHVLFVSFFDSLCVLVCSTQPACFCLLLTKFFLFSLLFFSHIWPKNERSLCVCLPERVCVCTTIGNSLCMCVCVCLTNAVFTAAKGNNCAFKGQLELHMCAQTYAAVCDFL